MGAVLECARLNGAHLEGADLREANLERANLIKAHLEESILLEANLKHANISAADLERADLSGANLEHASLSAANLKHADLSAANLERANLMSAHLEGANLLEASLEKAVLLEAHLEGTNLYAAHLEGAKLSEVHAEGANLNKAHLERANLSSAWLDSKTVLSDATLDTKTRLGDIQWHGVGTVNLTRINWSKITILGDEQGIGVNSHVYKHEATVRVYRQLAAQLRAQGMNEVADRFAERAQIRQRKLLFRRMLEDWRRYRPWHIPSYLLRWLFSWFLALLAGYGYHPGRSVFWYLATIIGFAALYSHFGVIDGHAFNPVEATVFSLTSFHGRGFFPGGLKLDDPVTVIAAVEAVIGLLIEISFIATFTQRFFGSK